MPDLNSSIFPVHNRPGGAIYTDLAVCRTSPYHISKLDAPGLSSFQFPVVNSVYNVGLRHPECCCKQRFEQQVYLQRDKIMALLRPDLLFYAHTFLAEVSDLQPVRPPFRRHIVPVECASQFPLGCMLEQDLDGQVELRLFWFEGLGVRRLDEQLIRLFPVPVFSKTDRHQHDWNQPPRHPEHMGHPDLP